MPEEQQENANEGIFGSYEAVSDAAKAIESLEPEYTPRENPPESTDTAEDDSVEEVEETSEDNDDEELPDDEEEVDDDEEEDLFLSLSLGGRLTRHSRSY